MSGALSESEVWGRVPAPDLRARFQARIEPCSCGTTIIAENDQATWPEIVGRHNRATPHVLWWLRVRCEWQGADPL